MPSFELLLDLSGTFVFALSGALLAVRKDLDIVGIIALAVTTGMGGGIVRDVLLGRTPPNALEEEWYLVVASLAALVVFFGYARIEQFTTPLYRLDALGLGLFAVSGTLISLDAERSIVQSVLLGVITGVGGGVIRDLMVREIPIVFRRDIYALAALVGAATFAAGDHLGASQLIASAAGVTATVALRLLSIRYDWHAPRPRKPNSS